MRLFFLLMLAFPIFAQSETYCFFQPPPNWEIADSKMLAKSSIIGFLDKSKSGFCPSINLATEKITVSKQEYLAIVQRNCTLKKKKWRHLGTIQTKAGEAELTEIETKTKFGPARLLQMIFIRSGTAYILTAGALKKDFGKQANQIETAMRSLTLTDDLFEAVIDPAKRHSLKKAWQKKQSGVESNSLNKIVLEECSHLGAVWQILMLQL